MPFHDITLNDGNKLPSLAFGSGSVHKGKDIHIYVEQALEAGFSHLDTAQYYHNEDSVGRGIRESALSRDDLYITTKWSFGPVREALESSLEELGLKYLDLYLIHDPRAIEDGDFDGVWKVFEQAREEGLVKSIGVSNFTVDQLRKLNKTARIKPAVNQIRLHPYNYTENIELLEYHAKHGIVTEAFGSLGPITKWPGGPVAAPLEKAAKRLGATPTQVLFLWVKAKGAVIVTTSSNKEHLKEYIGVGDLPDLTLEEIRDIDAAGANGPPLSLASLQSEELVRTVVRKFWRRTVVVSLIWVVGWALWFSRFGDVVRGMTRCGGM